MAELKKDKVRFDALRKLVAEAIRKELEIDFHCKSYEGTFEWTVCYPNYFEDNDGTAEPNYYILTLHCYVLGPARHYEWRGETKAEVLDKAEREIKLWLN